MFDWLEPFAEQILLNEAFMGHRRYQGAYTEAFTRGVYRAIPEKDIWVWHDDVKSMYPTSMIVLNLDPLTVIFVEKRPYTGNYRYDYESGLVEVPDSYLGQIVVRIDKKDGVTRTFMLDMRERRKQIRMDESLSGHVKKSRQLAIKLIMNATYGYHGLEYSRYGSFLVAILTVATGRLIMKEIIRIVDEDDRCEKLECDTDGLYHYGVDLSDQINDAVGRLFADYPLHHYLRVDTNKYLGMLVYRAKNYVLLDCDDNLKFKGSAFHGRHMPPICRTALNDFARAIFDKKPLSRVWRDYHDLRKFPLREFTMSVTLRKDPHGTEYGYDEHTMYHDLSTKLGEDVVWGQDVYYVKTVKGYVPLGTIPDSKLLRMVDRKYYLGRIRDVVKRLEWAAHGTKIIKVGRLSR